MFSKKQFLERYQKVPFDEYTKGPEEQPLVSVLVMAYNHENFISECIDSIISQNTDFVFEILIGEDGSTDNTRAICLKYADKYPDLIRLFLHSRENNIRVNGRPSWHFNSLNNLLSARGKYVAFCEGDDYWNHPEKLQQQVNVLNTNSHYSACSHLSDTIFDNIGASNENRFNKNPKKEVFKLSDFLEHTPFHTSSFMLRKGLLNFSKMSSCDLLALNRDHPIMLLLSSKGDIYRIPKVMSVYRRNAGGVSENIDFRSIFDANLAMIKALNCYLDNFSFKAMYMRGYWNRFLILRSNETFFKKVQRFLFYFTSSFYIFPKNGRQIFGLLNSLFFKK